MRMHFLLGTCRLCGCVAREVSANQAAVRLWIHGWPTNSNESHVADPSPATVHAVSEREWQEAVR